MSPSPSALPAGVRRETVHGTPALVVDTAASRAVIHLDGAHITSWVPAGGEDVLWMSAASRFAEGEAIRGGIPLVGPWFGPGRDGRTTPKHGWLRTHRWELESAEDTGGSIRVGLRLDGADPSGDGITARTVVEVGASLTVELTVTAGSAPLELESALHTYLAVEDVRSAEVVGLADVDYLDNLQGLARRHQEGQLTLTGATDRIYEASGPVEVRDPGMRRIIREVPSGSTRTVVWNPWEEGAQGIDDIADDAWPGFVCVETAAAKDGFIALAPGASHALGVEITAREG